MSDTVSLRLDSNTRQRLDNLSLATERSRAAIAAEAVRVYLDTQDWQIAAIKQGIIQADAGNLIDHAVLKTKWEKRLADQMDIAR
jgi:predicted transcriptional regulator